MNHDASSFTNISFLQVTACLLAGIACIILLTVRFRVHPFFALLIACFVTGLGMQMPFESIIGYIKTGMGDILSKLTLIIVLGTTIGVLLERNGATQVMANSILKLVGTKRSSLALSITGFIVGLPIFCDSGYIVLNGINKSLVRKTAFTIAQMSISLGSGLYAVHCLLPPHPGATAAAANLNVSFGRIILYGLVIAIPAMLIGHWWAIRAGKNSMIDAENEDAEVKEVSSSGLSVIASFLPVIVPIVLMALGSMTKLESDEGFFYRIVSIAGEPSVALAIGVLLALVTSKDRKKNLSHDLSVAVEKAGGILVIIAAGGAFGAILAAAKIGTHFSHALDLRTIGIWFPFLLTCILKTAQGSSTVAIVTASTILLPLLPFIGLDSDNGRLLSVLAMGAGSMMISHTNDAYFWVIAKFSSIDIKTMLKVHTIASMLMGLVTMIIIYLLSLFIL